MFDVGKIDVTTLRFGPDGVGPEGELRRMDVNRDGFPDLVARFSLATYTQADREAYLVGYLVDGREFQGRDTLITVGTERN